MPLLDRVVKSTSHLELQVYIPLGNDEFKLEKTIYVPWDRVNNTVVIDGCIYPVPNKGIVWKDRVLNFGPIPMLTVGHTGSLQLERGNAVPLTFGNRIKRDARLIEEGLKAERAINVMRNKEIASMRRQTMLVMFGCMITVVAIVVILNLNNIMAALKTASSGTTSGGGQTGPRLILKWVGDLFR